MPGRPQFILYLKGEIKLILTVIDSAISFLPCLSKVLEKLVNNQLTGFLDVYSILSSIQSGFPSGYRCVTATLKVLNDVTIDLAEAFDAVDHSILVGQLRSIGF